MSVSRFCFWKTFIGETIKHLLLSYIDENPYKGAFISEFSNTTLTRKIYHSSRTRNGWVKSLMWQKNYDNIKNKIDSDFMVVIYDLTFDFLVYTKLKPPTILGKIIWKK